MQGLLQFSNFPKLICLLVICLASRVHAEEISSSKSPQARDMRFVHPYSNFCRSLISEKAYLLKYQSWKVAQIPVICLPYLLEIKKSLMQVPGNCGTCSVEFQGTDFKPLYGDKTSPPTNFLYEGAMKTCVANICQPRPMNGSCTCTLKELAQDSASGTTPKPFPSLANGCLCDFHCFASDPKSNEVRDKCFVDVALKDFDRTDEKKDPPRTMLISRDIKCQCKENVFNNDKIELECQCEKK